MNVRAITAWLGRAVVLAVAGAAMLFQPAAKAQCTQTGDFLFFATHWIHGNGSVGLFMPNATTMVVDVNGNGSASTSDPADKTYNRPPVIQGNLLTAVLSPTRQFFISVGGTAAGGCDANRTVRVYSLAPGGGTMTLVHESCLPCTVFQGPLFWDTGLYPPTAFATPVTGQRVMLFRTGNTPCNPSNQAPPVLRWFDLNTPGSGGIADTSLGLLPGVGTLLVSRSGYQAMVQHDLTNVPSNSDFDIINLCNTPSTFGTIVQNSIGNRINDHVGFPQPTPSIDFADAGNVVVQMRLGSGGTVVFEAPLTNCCAGSPIGACCLSNGCVQANQNQCNGAWTANTSCEAAQCPPPPVAQLSFSMTGPENVVQQDFIDYAITYRNDGGAPAQNVVITDTIPSGVTFISATGSGVYNEGTRIVTWNIGTLPAQSGQQNLTIHTRAGCSVQYVINHTYRLNATGITIIGSPSVITAVNPAPVVGSASGSVTTTTTAPLPLLPGAVLRHEMTITNTSNESLQNIRIEGYPGYGTAFTAAISGGTGTFTLPSFPGYPIQWVGNLGPFQSTLLVFESTVTECIASGQLVTQLNSGYQWNIQTQCGSVLGSFPSSQAFGVRLPLEASLAVTNVQAGTIGPVTPGNSTYQDPMQLVRGTPVLDMALTITNNTGVARTAVDISIQLPFAWIIADPPFLGASPAGYTYDEPSRTIHLTGDVPAAGLPALTFRVQPDVPISNTRHFQVDRYIAPLLCSTFIGTLDLVNVPVFPTDPVILGAENFFPSGSLWIHRPGVDIEPNTFFRRAEVWNGLHKEPNGDIWIAGLPIFMFNPVTLTAASAPGAQEYVDGMGLQSTNTNDIAVDPTDGSLVFIVSGDNNGGPLLPPALVRYDRATATCTLITRDPALQYGEDVLIDAAGTIYVCNREVLARIPRTMPVPIPAGQVPLVAVPHPAYSFGPGAGTLTTQKPHAIGWSCEGGMLLLHASTFVGGTNPDAITVDTTVYALSRYDPASNTIVVAQPQVAANAFGQGNRQWPAEFSPQLPVDAVLASSCITGGEYNQAIIANSYYPYHCIYAIDTPTGAATPIEPAVAFHFHGAADILYLNGGCNAGPTCDPDFTCDGNADQDDVGCIVDVIAGNPGCECQDPDFNRDGNVDQDDVAALINVVAGGGCP